VDLASVNSTHLAPKAAVLSEITRNDGHWAVQITQRHRFWYESKARVQMPINE